MPELDSQSVVLERVEQPFEVAAGIGLVLEASGELCQQRAELGRARKRIDGRAEFIHVRAIDIGRILAGRLVEHLRVRELLIELQ